MIIKRVLAILSLLLIGISLSAAAPYATINYAEGSSFLLIRDGKTNKILVDSPDVLGMELRSGDILQTSSSTYLEISIKSISANIQVAENTSFKCAVDSSGVQVSGELYYGRVRAKVTKLAGASTFHISTPSMVAGVRGTNFGCDVIAARPQNLMVITNRVFCFEGSVAIDDLTKTVPDAILIGSNEMVEKIVDQRQTVAQPIQKTTINPEINAFWEEHPLSGTTVTAKPATGTVAADATPKAEPVYIVVEHKWPEGRKEVRTVPKAAIPAIAAITFGLMGTAACIVSGYNQGKSLDGNILDNNTFKAGLVLIGTGSVCALIAAILH